MILNSSYILLFFVGIVSSNPSILNTVSSNNGYKLSTDLRGTYSQQPLAEGYHKAEIYFKTKVPSLNPDLAGVSNIECKDNKINLTLNDKNAIKQINNWPTDKVMLLISHKWECFGNTTTQFFMAENKTIDMFNNVVAFDVKECDILDWAEDFLVDLSWVNEKTKRRRNRLDRRIEGNSTLSLNVLFDETTKGSSNPNIPIFDDKLFCSNCFMNGQARVAFRLAASIAQFKLTEATIAVSGNVKLNLDFAVNGTKDNTITSPDFTLVSIPIIPGFNIPNLFKVGPSIDLDASASVSNVTGSATFGIEVDFPNFNANATFVNEPTFIQSGFKPEIKLHDLKNDFSIDTSLINVTGTLKPRLVFGIEAIKLFSQKAGFEIVANLDNNISNDNCEGTHLKTSFNGDVGFFFNDDNFSITKFPSKTLFDGCV